jgi:hypothetical protein
VRASLSAQLGVLDVACALLHDPPILDTVRRILFLVVMCSLLAGCSRGAELIINNESDETLRNVVAYGERFSHEVGTIAPHSEASARIDPRGEAELRLRFNAGTRSVTSPHGVYFEGGYRVTVTVSDDLDVRMNSESPSYR